MPTPYREAVMQAIINTLAPLGAVVRNPEDVYTGPYPATLVYDGEQDADYGNHGITRYRLVVPVECMVQSSAANIGTALNEQYAAVVAAMMANHTLGGLAVDVVELSASEPNIDETRAAKRVGTIGITFAVDYVTPQGNPYVD